MPITPETHLAERHWSFEEAPELVRVHAGVAVPRTVRAWGPAHLAPDGERVAGADQTQIEIECAFDDGLGHYLLRRLELRVAGSADVSGQTLRAIAPLSLMRWILPRAFHIDRSVLSIPVVNFIAPEMQEYRREETGPEPERNEMLVDVAAIYKLATVVRYAPAKAVAEAFALQPRTATNWVSRSRDAGLL